MNATKRATHYEVYERLTGAIVDIRTGKRDAQGLAATGPGRSLLIRPVFSDEPIHGAKIFRRTLSDGSYVYDVHASDSSGGSQVTFGCNSSEIARRLVDAINDASWVEVG